MPRKKQVSKKKANKQKKPKVVYYDDGSTIADMSGVQGGIASKISSPKNSAGGNGKNASAQKHRSTAREKVSTFFSAMKMMLIPTAIALAVLAVLYLVIFLITQSAQ